jgi:hypothetical protein
MKVVEENDANNFRTVCFFPLSLTVFEVTEEIGVKGMLLSPTLTHLNLFNYIFCLKTYLHLCVDKNNKLKKTDPRGR